MMTKKLHKKISSKFKGRVYHNWGAVKKKVAHIRKFTGPMKGKKILEIGCNAGIVGFDLANAAESYIGIDKKELYYKQALITQKHMSNKNVKFYNERFKEFIQEHNRDYDTLYLSYVLYHFRDEEVELLKEKVLPNCNTILIYSRNEKRKNVNNKYRLESLKNILKFFRDFDNRVHWGHDKTFFCVFGRRKNGKDSEAQGQIEADQAGQGGSDTEGRGALDK